MYLANRNANQDGKTLAKKAAELSELRKRLLEMILHNEALRRGGQLMRSHCLDANLPQPSLPTC